MYIILLQYLSIDTREHINEFTILLVFKIESIYTQLRLSYDKYIKVGIDYININWLYLKILLSKHF